MHISVIIPLFNEAENVPALAQELRKIPQQNFTLEALLVDDGSTDPTWSEIEKCSAEHSFIRGIRSPKNRGQTAATLLGFKHASGDVFVTMDGDLQNNPADIPKLVEKLSSCDVVCGYRAKRRDSLSRRIASRIGNGIRNWVTRDGLIDTGCSLKAFKKECASDIPPLNGAHRFMGAYFKLHERKMEQIPVDHRPRVHGVSKYTNLKRLPRTLFDLIGFVWYRQRLLR